VRIGVVGASGNLGTALLRRLHGDPDLGVAVAVARRTPRGTPPAPYGGPRWLGCDIGAPGPDGPVVSTLAGAFDGLDAVVHLAWQIQPSHDRDRLRRTNVDGSRRVVEAAVAAGVPHLVAASSLGAYTPVHDDVPRDETWETRGTPTSQYSVDKVAQEKILDAAGNGLKVARMRPALVFQRPAGSALERYFLGPAAPARLLRHRLPVLPWPRGYRAQAVHADDVAEAFRAVLLGRRTGAFNLAADDVLTGPVMAGLLAGGRLVEVPPRAVRAALHGAWLARLAALSPGWIDLAGGAPLLDTRRAREELGWRPQHSARSAVVDLLAGMAHGAGTASPVLRPRHRARPSPLGGQSARW
jgi:UDP-glucose 4-epimerase